MNNKYLFVCILALLDICVSSVFAQTHHSQKFEISKDSLHQKTIDYLQENEFCIDCVDLQSGFIKAKKYIDREKLLSTSVGIRIELSIFVKPVKDDKSAISLTIYTVSLDKNPAYHQEGICKDDKLYKTIIQGIKSTNIRRTESEE